MPRIKATDVAKKYEGASAVEIRNLAAKMKADVDWTGWSEPVAQPDNPERPLDVTQPYQMTPEGRLREEQRASAALSPRGIASTAANFLPAVVGATAGGATMLATKNLPTTMAAEGAGNALGEKMRIEAMRAMGLPTPQDEGRSIREQAIVGTMGPAIASGVGAIGRGVSRQLYNDALSPTKGMLREFPDVVEYGLAGRIPVTQLGGGRAQSAELVQQGMGPTSQALDAALAQAEAAGQTIQRHKVIQALNRLKNKYSPRSGASGVRASQAAALIEEERKRFMADYPRLIPPSLAQKAKRYSADFASNLYDAVQSGGRITSDDPVMEQVHKEIADVLRGELRALPTYGQQIDALNQTLQPDITLAKALENAGVSPQPKYSPEATRPLSIINPSRNMKSRAAIAMSGNKAKAANQASARSLSALFPWRNQPMADDEQQSAGGWMRSPGP